jgi:drug/metabolite transporter (DMT)-like permease
MVLRRKPVRVTPQLAAGVAALAMLDAYIPFLLVAWASHHIDAGISSVLISTMPLFTTLFALTVLPDERLTPVRVAGVITGFCGTAVLAGSTAVQVGAADALGLVAVTAAAASFGVGAIVARITMRSIDPVSLSAAKLTLASAVAIVAMFATGNGGGYTTMPLSGWAGMFYLGVISTGIAFSMYFWVVSTVGSVRASLGTFVVPVAGLLTGWAFLGESVTPRMAPGIALIIVGVVVVVYEAAVTHWLRRIMRPPAARTPAPSH